MKKIVAFAFLLVSLSTFAIEKENVKSSISDVTVYMQGAQVFRKASFTVKPGITDIIIDGICPTIDPKSIQVKAFGNVVILDSKYSLFYPQPEPVKMIDGLPLKVKKDIQLIEDSITAITYDLSEIQDEIDVLNATKSILTNNGAIRGQGKVNDSIQLLKQAIDYYNLKMNEINKKLLALNKRKNEKNAKKAGMQSRLSNLRNFQNTNGMEEEEEKGPIHRLTITVQSSEIVAGKLSFSYLVSGAGWTPLYDLKSDVLSNKVNLTYKAQVFQNTGVNWDNVKLTISTNNPYMNKTKPTLHPWYIDYYAYSQPAYGAYGYATPAPTTVDSYSKQSSKDMEDQLNLNTAMTSAQFVTMVNQVISAEFRIDLPYTIESNNEAHMVLIKNQDLGASFKYYSVPKLDPSVYLVAQISKLDELQLVPAKANIFFDGTYMGETYIDPTNMEDTLNLSLGKDPNIIIKRTLLKKESKEKIIGAQKERINSFEIEVKNLKSTSIELIIQDQIPITTNAEIEIESLENSRAKLDATTGIMEWEIDLKTKESKKIGFSYKVKYNKDKNVHLQ